MFDSTLAAYRILVIALTHRIKRFLPQSNILLSLFIFTTAYYSK